ncbi:MAG: hypothetical protein ABW321_08955 [Polyangiales bacterium]
MRLPLCALPWLALWACADDAAPGPCLADRDCEDGACVADEALAPEDLARQPLACSAAPRLGAVPGAACHSGKDCDHGLCLLASTCARSCVSADDCGDGQRCQPVYTRSAFGLARVSACVDAVNLPADARVTRTQSVVHGSPDDVLTLPRGADQTLYVVEHVADTTWPIPSSTTTCRPPLCAARLSSDDQVLFDRGRSADEAGPLLAVAQGSHVDPLTVWAPNGPRVEPAARVYTLEVESKVAGAVHITAISRSERGLRLDLNLYYVGAAGLVPEGARGVPQLEAALERVDAIFEPAGIFIGDVRQSDVPGALPDVGSELPGAEVSAGFRTLRSQYQVLPELPALLRLSAGAANSGLDVFFVADIAAHGADVGGIAGGTPVPFGMHGTPGSGIVVATDMFLQADAPEALGRTLAHELGHALGLFHTIELDGTVTDPLPDTPACPITRDLDRSGSLDADECAAHGGDNLMFPTSDAGTQLTAQQREVLRAALLLQ